MNIALYANEQSEREFITCCVKQYCFEQMWDCRIDEYCNIEELNYAFVRNCYDMVFLDLSGAESQVMEYAKKIRRMDSGVIMVLVANTEEYFKEGYLLGVRNYILKPIESSSIRSAIRRSSKYICDLKQTVEVVSENSTLKLCLQDIQYIESKANMRLVHTKQFTVRTKKPLNVLEKELSGGRFLRIHENYLVNMDAILKKSESFFHIINGDKVPISSVNKGIVLKQYLEYQLEAVKR